MNRVSVIIPAYREGNRIAAVLANVSATFRDAEVIVSDGSDCAATRQICSRAGAVYHAPPDHRRAAAMNSAAKRSNGEVLLFLHADTFLPAGARALETLDLAKFGYGGFYKSFSPNTKLLRLHALAANWWKLELQREFLGDNAIFVRRDLFQALGGYSDLSLFEDLDLSRRLRALTAESRLKSRIFRCAVVTSSRRFQKRGVIPTIYVMQRCRFWYAAGISTEEIARRYARLSS